MNLKIIFASFTAAIALVGSAAERNIPQGYYTGLDGKKGAELKRAVYNAIKNHKEISYGDKTWSAFSSFEVKPDGTWWDIYSNERRYASSGHSGMNIEHAVANSWWGGTKNAAYKDINHLYPSDSNANSRKSNYPLGETDNPTWTNGVTIIGKPKNGHGGQGGYIYEPADEYKGDNARTYFYMAARYPDISWKTNTSWGIMFSQEDYPTLCSWGQELLLRWNSTDVVSQKEIDRNEGVYREQGNRNPFIDFPDLAEYIWGSKVNEPFDLNAHLGLEPGKTPELVKPQPNEVIDCGAVIIGQTGYATLVIKGNNLKDTTPLSLAIYDNSSTDDAALFSVDEGATTTVSCTAANSASGVSVRIEYRPDSKGVHETRMRIRGGGLTGNTFITLKGEGLPVTELVAPHALPPTDVTSDSYIANWEDTSGQNVDYYVVTRTIYTENGSATTVKEEQSFNGDYSLAIEDFNGNESYTVRAVYSGIQSPESNAITVNRTSISEIDNEGCFGISAEQGGLRIFSTETLSKIVVYEPNGRTAAILTDVSDGTRISLPRGLYILRAPNRRPVKALVK